MSEGLYELLALCARYVFAGLMALIVVRACRITIVDSRRAKTLRRISPETGIIGELMVLEGDEKARHGMKYKVIREGQIGSGRRADIRVRHSSVRRRHACFLLMEEGLRVRAHAGAPLRDGRGRSVREILLRDGGIITVGRVKLMLILSDAHGPARAPHATDRRPAENAFDDGDIFGGGLFDTAFDDDDALFGGPVRRPEPPRPPRRCLPLSVEDDPSGWAHSRPRSPSAGNRSAGFRVEENPLNRSRPRNAPPADDFDDDEMW